MSQRMTAVCLPGAGLGLAGYGRRDPHVMIAHLRRDASERKEQAERILSAPESEFVVETHLGIHAQRRPERLWPPAGAGEGLPGPGEAAL